MIRDDLFRDKLSFSPMEDKNLPMEDKVWLVYKAKGEEDYNPPSRPVPQGSLTWGELTNLKGTESSYAISSFLSV